jgi:hypothetical protein
MMRGSERAVDAVGGSMCLLLLEALYDVRRLLLGLYDGSEAVAKLVDNARIRKISQCRRRIDALAPGGGFVRQSEAVAWRGRRLGGGVAWLVFGNARIDALGLLMILSPS